jgi:hypothetical protein
MRSDKNAVKIISIGALLCFLLIHASAKESSIVIIVQNDLKKISRINNHYRRKNKRESGISNYLFR